MHCGYRLSRCFPQIRHHHTMVICTGGLNNQPSQQRLRGIGQFQQFRGCRQRKNRLPYRQYPYTEYAADNTACHSIQAYIHILLPRESASSHRNQYRRRHSGNTRAKAGQYVFSPALLLSKHHDCDKGAQDLSHQGTKNLFVKKERFCRAT